MNKESSKRYSSPMIVLATGGTGGHVFPAQALAQEMLARNWKVHLFIDERARQFARNFPNNASWQVIPVASITQGGTLKRIFAPLMMSMGILKALIQFLANRPKVIVGFGSYVSLPPMIGALILRIPSLIHEQNRTMGKVNKLLSSRVQCVASGSKDPDFPNGLKWERTGNPVRREIIDYIPSKYELEPNAPVNLLVLGGSQGANIFDEVIPKTIQKLPPETLKRIRITQQVRSNNLEIVRKIYEKLSLEFELKPFFKNVPSLMAKTHLIIGRSGASSIAEITAMGLPSILIPFGAAANDHQTDNAEVLQRVGAAEVISEKILTPQILGEKVQNLLMAPDRLQLMAKSSKKLSIINAAERLADLVEDTVKGESR